jgi:valyl-tRNA synthetase
MIYSGIEFQKIEPFQKVLIHGTILTKDGKRMSKSLGTGIDPLKYVEEFGADATRFGIVWQATGQDIRWDESAVHAGKKFANKIWNAGKYIAMQIEKYPKSDDDADPKTDADINITNALAKIRKSTEEDIVAFEFSKALHNLYDFFWHDLCDIYLEASKKQLDDEVNKNSTLNILTNVFRESLKLLHPFMPFVTEEIYGRFPFKNKSEFLMIETIE